MLNNALIFVISALLNFLTALFLLRFYFQLVKIPFQNPIGQMVVALTNFAVKPFRRIVPSIGKFDVATFLLAFVTQISMAFIVLWLHSSILLTLGGKALLAACIMAISGIIGIMIGSFMAAVLLYVILSWVHPHSPAMPFLYQFTNPVMRHFRKWIPLVGNFDLSPLVFTIVAQLLLIFLNSIEQNLLASLISS